MKQSIKRCALLVASSSLLAAFSASAANTFYAPGDLVLFFQQAGGTNTVYADLGSAATQFRGATAGADSTTTRINFLDLSTTLSTAFGAGWASDPTVYAGLGGVYSTNNTSSALVNGDPYRTLYVSASRDSVGTVGDANSTGWVIGGNTAMTDAASGIQSMNNVFATQASTQVAIMTTDVSQIGTQNPFIAPGIQGPGFNVFDGGVQQQGSAASFGTMADAGSTEFALDLYRIVAKTGITGEVAGDLRSGSFEGTVTVGSNGMVSFVPEPSALALGGLALGALALRRRRSA